MFDYSGSPIKFVEGDLLISVPSHLIAVQKLLFLILVSHITAKFLYNSRKHSHFLGKRTFFEHVQTFGLCVRVDNLFRTD